MERKDTERILELYKNVDAEIQMRMKEMKDIDDKYADPPSEIKDDRQRILEEIGILGTLRGAIRQEIDRLSTYEKIIIVKFYVDKKSLVHISGQIHYSEPQCRNIKRRALDKLGARFENNKVIPQYYRSLSGS